MLSTSRKLCAHQISISYTSQQLVVKLGSYVQVLDKAVWVEGMSLSDLALKNIQDHLPVCSFPDLTTFGGHEFQAPQLNMEED